MAGVESYGGSCPKCSKGMLQKWESSGYGFMFDACPWCGFAYGTQDLSDIESSDEVWTSILKHHDVSTRKELIEYFRAFGPFPEYVTEEESEFYPSLFDHSDIQKVSQ